MFSNCNLIDERYVDCVSRTLMSDRREKGNSTLEGEKYPYQDTKAGQVHYVFNATQQPQRNTVWVHFEVF